MRREHDDTDRFTLSAITPTGVSALMTDPVQAIQRTLSDVAAVMSQRQSLERVRFAASFSDGEQLWGFRWSSDERPPTLYHRAVDGGTVLASEPFDENPTAWIAVPPNTAICISADGSVNQMSIDVPILAVDDGIHRPVL